MKHVNIRATSLHAAVIGFANAILQAFNAFGAHLDVAQDTAITGLVNAGLVMLSVLIIWSTSDTNGSKGPGDV